MANIRLVKSRGFIRGEECKFYTVRQKIIMTIFSLCTYGLSTRLHAAMLLVQQHSNNILQKADKTGKNNGKIGKTNRFLISL